MGTAVGGAVASAVLLAGALQLGPALSGVPPLLRRISSRSAGTGLPGSLALTFDDGPHPDGTRAILSTLDERACRATFFLVAEQVLRHPDLVRRIVGNGHEVAVHGWTHVATPLVSPRVLHSQLRDAVDLITTVSSTPLSWYRPPYGVASGSALATSAYLGLRPVWWTRWGRDWDPHASPRSIAQRVLSTPRSRPGSSNTVLLHDSDSYGHPGSWRRTNAALSLIIDGYTDAGVSIGTVSEHLRAGLTPISAQSRSASGSTAVPWMSFPSAMRRELLAS